MSYIGNEPIVSATRTITEVTATAGQTVFVANGGYTVGYIDVFLNGAQLQTVDFTTTDGSSITLTEAAQVGDVLKLVAWGTFQTSSALSSTNPSYSGTLTGGTGVVNIGSGQVYKDASGNVGIGTSSPAFKLDVSATGNILGRFKATGTLSALFLADANTTADTLYIGTVGNNFRVVTSSEERMRIDSSGNLLVGTTSQSGKLTVEHSSAGSWTSTARNASSSGQGLISLCTFSQRAPNDASSVFHYANDNVGVRFLVYSNGGIYNYQANNANLSDRREKTNFAPAGEYLSKICAIPVQTFNYIDQNLNEDDGLTLGVIAQDVQAVAPELVSESDWSAEKDGSKMRLSIYQTDLQYALMKCIQEQQTIIEELNSRVEALENK